MQTIGKKEETEEAIRDAATPAEPSSAYEEARRKATHDARELWNFVRVRLKVVELQMGLKSGEKGSQKNCQILSKRGSTFFKTLQTVQAPAIAFKRANSERRL